MSHEHHHHHHAPTKYDRAFVIGIGLNVAVVLIEVIYGLKSHSLALISDAGHNATDVLGLILAGAAMVLSRRRPTVRHTYGLRRSSILAALANAVFLIFVIGALSWEAITRLSHPEPVDEKTIIVVAAISMLLNALTAFLFRREKSDLNIRSAYAHMAADAFIALGVVLTGVAIHFSGLLWLDPAVSLVIGIVIAYSTWNLLVESFNLAMDAVPAGIKEPEVREYLLALPEVCEVHDLHIWAMSTTETALTVHLVSKRDTLDNDLLSLVTHDLHSRFGIDHPTVQIELETPEHACALSDPTHV